MVQHNNLKNGDILICKGKSWISRMIMKFTKGTWSHSALYATVWGASGVIEAQKNGVNHKLWGVWRWKWDYDYVVFRNIHEFNEKELMLKAFSKCGETKYDFKTFILRIPFRLFGGKNKERKNEDRKMICSEFTSWVWNIEGWYQMTPQEQYDYLINSKNWVQIKS